MNLCLSLLTEVAVRMTGEEGDPGHDGARLAA